MLVDTAANIRGVLAGLPDNVTLVAVSKYHPNEQIEAAYACGQRVFGESHVQELEKKHESLPQDIRWHFIGHLQTNKVKYIAPYVSMIDAVDSFKLLREIDKHAARHGRTIDVLVELHVAEEDTKYGFTIEDCRRMFEAGEWRKLANVRICGLMTMASNVDDEAQIEREFMLAADFFDEVKSRFFAGEDYFCERSWGMSDDYKIAIRCRSTMVRIGTTIFGERVY